MATWTGTGANNNNYTGTLTVTEDSYNVAGNSSTVSYSLVLTGNNGYYYQNIGTTTQVSINGSLVQDRSEQITMPVPSEGVSTVTICSGTVQVPHNADGTKTITVWAKITTPTTQTYLPGEVKVPSGLNGSLTLTTIPRQSTMTIPTMTIQESATFNISASSNTFSHTITYSIGSLTGTAATASAGTTSVSWTPPSTFYAQTPQSDSAYITLVLHTFSGGTEIGSTTYSNKIMNVGADIKPTVPTVTLTPVNTNAWLNTNQLYVGGYSKVKIDSSASPGTGSYISGYTITNDVTGSGASFTSDVLSAGNKTISVTASDARGRTNFRTVYVTFQEYSNPKFSTFKAVRGTYNNGTWTSNEYGNHIRVQAVGSVSLSSSGNVGTKTVKIGNTNPAATSGNYYYFTNTNATTSYTISGTITDSVGNTGTKSITVGANPSSSTLTVPTLTIEQAATLTVTAASNTFTHTITYSFSGLSGTAATLNAGVTTATWTPPNTFYAKLPNSTSGEVTLVLKTYSGGTEIGSNTYTATVNVGSAIKPTAPTVTLTPVNTNAWINSQGLYVGGYSKVKVQSSATAGSGASISSYTISGAFSATGSNKTSDILTAGNKTIKVTATDTRGRSNSTTQTVTFLSYSNPAITTFKATRGTYAGGSWTSDTNGDHIRIQAVGSVSLSNEGNTGTITVKTGNTNPDATSGNYYYFTSTNATTSYTFTGTITDSVGNTVTRILTVPTITVPLNINVDLPGVGVGMIAQNSNQLDINSNWTVSPYKLKGSQYYTGGYFGINMNNSDIVGANSFYFRDVTDGYSEGIHFIDSNGKYDTIWADGGAAYIRPSHTIGTADTVEKRLLTVDDLYFKAGDTYSCQYLVLNGIITSSTKGLRFTWRSPKRLDNVTAVTVSAMTGTMRGVQGYLNSDSSIIDWTTAITITTHIRSSWDVGLELEASTAFTNVTNNTPVAFYANTSFVLTFA